MIMPKSCIDEEVESTPIDDLADVFVLPSRRPSFVRASKVGVI